jgi:hypothetical protein
MAWQKQLAERLCAFVPCGYQQPGPPAVEPTCLAAMALSLQGRKAQSRQALQWLKALQNADGSFGPTFKMQTPGWPTALAILAGGYVGRCGANDVLGLAGCPDLAGHSDEPHVELHEQPFRIDAAVQWLLSLQGRTIPRGEIYAHNSMLVGWPWVKGTHSWIEPTALAVLALKSVGHGDHPRTREGVRVLHDRLLPDGGCNYGNTFVLGQQLLPHIQPTGLTLLALDGEQDDDGRIARSVDWLERAIDRDTAAASLAYAVWALARYGRAAENAERWLAGASRRKATLASPYRMALLLLAAAALRTENSVQTQQA